MTTIMRRGSKKAQKKIIMIAGPNGAGKTTFAREFLPNEAHCPEFINADLIAQGLSPFAPQNAAIQAARVMLTQIADKVEQRESFAFETTLAGRAYAHHIPRWRRRGYRVKLIFLSLPNVNLAISRVRTRVEQGGHDVPEAVIRRRFAAGLKNFHALYKRLVDAWDLYDNAEAEPVLLESGVMK